MISKVHNQQGQTLIELVVVTAVSVIVVGALTFATVSSLRNAQFAKNQSQATQLAQEAIEEVRSGRDQNRAVIIPISNPTVSSWNGDSNGAPIWSYQINGSCGNFTLTPPTYCYFKLTDNQGSLQYIGTSATLSLSLSEAIPPTNPVFHRAIYLSDDATTYSSQKTVTAVVQWTDFSGTHQSTLSTILGNTNQ